jgi:3-(3-hydroxy-phenyl)propionate hydroxylase
VRLLADGTRFLGLWLGASDGEIASLDALCRRLPLAVRPVERDGPLARHLGARPGSFVLVRPDAYVAATSEAPSAARVEAALRGALGEGRTR